MVYDAPEHKLSAKDASQQNLNAKNSYQIFVNVNRVVNVSKKMYVILHVTGNFGPQISTLFFIF